MESVENRGHLQAAYAHVKSEVQKPIENLYEAQVIAINYK